MNERESLIHAIDEISNLHDLGKKTNETLRKVALHSIAMEKLLIEKEVFTKEELTKEIEKQKRP